ncbi:cold-shock protein [Rhodococcus sp. 06-412-2C]|uniref:N-acetylmuramoyl-L-alanine amidase n=1 Tax=unclassified Rhodococcus (in: high G+C Gram-positive bacteria) TaxID=192944 RepID=UPI000B9AA67D|nr:MULTISPECIES: N-acetylmuramoyl-L-alanine amidase [unclassified Rhodococcus (in: high G+C Gram-positive bacteria)]OZC88587.1 cold-shock protein [Rhodococcus sp. 06-412-2C]OZD02952.1 cold-shock protein [Rhodococcus sp. 06-412-2B]
MPNRRTKPSIVLGAVALLAVATPFTVAGLTDSTTTGVRPANETTPVTVPTTIVETALSAAPDIVIPLQELTGLPLPDLRLSDLKYLPLPDSIVIPPIQIPDIPGLTTPAPGNATAQAPIPRVDASAPVNPEAADPTGPPLGAAVKEISQDTPFSMVALTSEQLNGASAQVRRQLEDGSWGPWLQTAPVDSTADDSVPAAGKQGTEPIFVGLTKAVQVLLTPLTSSAAPESFASAPVPEVPVVELPAADAPAEAPAADAPAAEAPAPAAAEQPLGYTPASSSKPLRQQDPAPVDPAAPIEPAQPEAAPESSAEQLASAVNDISAVLITPGTSPADSALSDLATPVAGDAGPKVITRAQWGADESIRCATPTIDDFIGGATVHHTAGSNDYSKSESAEIVRAIYAYHAQTLGWCDIGYNALVDKYGQIFEGRAGGLDKPVQGAHAGGFNENTVGVAMMGDYSTEDPSQETVDSVGKFLGWRLGKAGLDPKGTTTMTSEGTDFTFIGKGKTVDLPVIFGHRDVGNTECPGDAGYARLGEIRDIAAANLGGGDATPASPDTTDTAPDTAVTDPAPSRPGTDASSTLGENIPALVAELQRLASTSPVAQKWLASGGETGSLGVPVSGLVQVSGGREKAQFQNGEIITNMAGQAVAVIGKIFQQYLQQGGVDGVLGLPITDEFKVPEGFRTDFENGSLIFNELTGIVTTVIKTYNDTYNAEMQNPAAAPVEPAPAPEAAPAG